MVSPAYIDPDLPYELEWKSTHLYRPIRNVYDGSEDLKLRFMISAAGNVMAYTSTGMEVWGTDTGYSRRL